MTKTDLKKRRLGRIWEGRQPSTQVGASKLQPAVLLLLFWRERVGRTYVCTYVYVCVRMYVYVCVFVYLVKTYTFLKPK